MTSVLSSIADALIEFILSLLRDPSAMEEFEADPEGMLERNGLEGVNLGHVQAVKPVIVDHPYVINASTMQFSGGSRGSSQQSQDFARSSQGSPAAEATPAVREIQTISQNFHYDNRSTVVDQSVNQNIWTEGGDVMQIFDQQANMAIGDESNAAGRDIDHSSTDIDAGDIAIGNTDMDTAIDGSFNQDFDSTQVDVDVTIDDSFNTNTESTDVDVDVSDSFQDNSTDVDVDVDSEGSFNDSSTNVDTDVDVSDSFNHSESTTDVDVSSSSETYTNTVVTGDGSSAEVEVSSSSSAVEFDEGYEASMMDESYEGALLDEF